MRRATSSARSCQLSTTATRWVSTAFPLGGWQDQRPCAQQGWLWAGLQQAGWDAVLMVPGLPPCSRQHRELVAPVLGRGLQLVLMVHPGAFTAPLIAVTASWLRDLPVLPDFPFLKCAVK